MKKSDNFSSDDVIFEPVTFLHGNDAAPHPRVQPPHVRVHPRHPGFPATDAPADGAPQKVATRPQAGHRSATVALASVLGPVHGSRANHVFVDEPRQPIGPVAHFPG